MGWEVVEDDDVFFEEGQGKLSLDIGLKDASVCRSSRVTVRSKHLKPATKVWVFQCPNGALELSHCPCRHQPRGRTIFVVVPVSSMKMSRCGSSCILGSAWPLGAYDRPPSGWSCFEAGGVFHSDAVTDQTA